MARASRYVAGAGTREELAEFLVGRHPGTVAVFRHFTYAHLPAHLAAVSAPICAVAAQMVDRLPDGPELTAGLRKLLEAKDCMVRAAVEMAAAEDHVDLVDQGLARLDDPLALQDRIDRHAGLVAAEMDAARDAR